MLNTVTLHQLYLCCLSPRRWTFCVNLTSRAPGYASWDLGKRKTQWWGLILIRELDRFADSTDSRFDPHCKSTALARTHLVLTHIHTPRTHTHICIRACTHIHIWFSLEAFFQISTLTSLLCSHPSPDEWIRALRHRESVLPLAAVVTVIVGAGRGGPDPRGLALIWYSLWSVPLKAEKTFKVIFFFFWLKEVVVFFTI